MDQLVKAFISRSALRHNVRLIQKTAAETPICAMIKAAAYGHNAALVVKALEGIKIACWGVATINEAVELRDLHVPEPIMVMRPLTRYDSAAAISEQIRLMRRLDIRPTLTGDDVFDLIAKTASDNSAPLRAHIKTDTGMGRTGCPAEETSDLLRKAVNIKGLAIEGIYTHLACADDENLDCALGQLTAFNSTLDKIKSLGINIPIRHMANSGAIFRMPEARFDMVRPGRAIYGYTTQHIKTSEYLVPVMRVAAPVVFTKWVKKGTACSYGHTFKFRRDTRVGLLPLGYADGYSRQWSNAGKVDFHGKLAPVIGRICMDLTIVDLTDIPEATTGAQLCVISNRRADPHSMESMAKRLATLPHEIGCVLGNRIQRILTE